MKEYIVYKHTSPFGKVYIGITCQLPCQRWARGKGYPGNGVRREVSEETRKKLSESHKHRSHISGPAHPQWGKRGPESQNYGRRHTPEELKLMRANNTRKIPVVCVEDGVRYDSAQEAAEAKNTHRGSIINCCRHVPHYNTAGGCHWRFVDGD